eukprot:m.132629 g.132629  ORF g.132629 m.132629 type:complete len:785 (+) comp16851_c0_seq3:98-2452(+)
MASGLRSRAKKGDADATGGVDFSVVRQGAAAGKVTMVIKGMAYDFTDFANDHPGGPEYLRKNAGKDATEEFVASHPVDIIERTLSEAQMSAMHLGNVDAATIKAEDVAKHTGHAEADGAAAGPSGEKPTVDGCINLYDFEAITAQTIPKQGWAYYSSGADDEITLRENHSAFHRIWLRPRVMVNVKEIDMRTTILGHESSCPVFLSAIAMCKLGHPDGEVAKNRAAGAEGIIYMIPTLSSCALDEIVDSSLPKQPMFFQLYVNQDKAKVQKLVQRAEALGCSALFITCDAPQLGNREKDRRVKISHTGAAVQQGSGTVKKSEGTSKALTTFIDPSLSWDDLPWFQSITKMKIVLKGVATAEDAVLALEKGCAGVLLSNHGGRQLDFARSAIEILPEVMDALKKHEKYDPKKFEVYIDGGVRRGTDVFKAIALGAKAVGIGRPALYAMSAFGQEGVEKMIRIVKEELEMTMRLMGTPTLGDIKKDMVILDDLNKHNTLVPRDFLQRETYIPKMSQAHMQGYTRAAPAPGSATTAAPSADAAMAAAAAKAAPAGEPTVSEMVGKLAFEMASSLASTIVTTNARLSVHRTAVVLILYLFVHVASNALVFAGKGIFNDNYLALSGSGLVRAVELYLLAAAVLHVGFSVYLTISMKKLSIPKGKSPLSLLERAKLFLSGVVVLVFVVVHLQHFRFGDEASLPLAERDLYGEVTTVLHNPQDYALYMAGNGLLGVHLWFGWAKTCNKFALTGANKRFFKPVAAAGQVLCAAVTLGFAAIASAIHFDLVKA